jgi:nucleotide-binding universal stress UspA family protein
VSGAGRQTAETIIVPLDRSATAERVLPFAATLARQVGAQLDLLCVIDLPYELEAWLHAQEIIDQRLDVEDEYEQYLQLTATSITGVPVNRVLRAGSAATEIQKHAEQYANPIVVMCKHGQSGIRQAVVGSVTMQVVHRLSTPVVVVPSNIAGRSETVMNVLVPLDGSPSAEDALERGLRIFGNGGLTVNLLRVIETGDIYSQRYQQFIGYEDTLTAIASDYLTRMQLRVEDSGCQVRFEIRPGNAADQIAAAAQQCGAQMIIMSTHGRGRIGRLIFGSVAEQVLKETVVPLMLVRSPEVQH